MYIQAEKEKQMREQELVRRQRELDNYIAQISELMTGHEWSQAQFVIDQAKKTVCKPENLIAQDDIQEWEKDLNDKEREIQTLKRKEGGISTHLSGVNKIGTLQGKIKSWMKTISQTEGRDQLTDDERTIILQTFITMPQKELKPVADRKKKIWSEFEKLVGSDFVDIIFSKLFS